MCRPMKRFYNHGTEHAAKINLHDAAFMLKLDGSCIKVWWDSINEQWSVGTRGMAKAHTKIGGLHMESGFTFTTLFKRAVGGDQKFDEFCLELDKNNTYVFELCSPYNKVVVPYPNTFITILAVIETQTGKEFNIWGLPQSKFYLPVERFDLASAEAMLEFINAQNPAHFEGLVMLDLSNHNRVKVKHPGYLAIASVRDSMSSPRNVMELILLDKIDDAIPLLEGEVLEFAKTLQVQTANFLQKNEQVWLELKAKGLPSRKDFALYCQAQGLELSLFMNLWTGTYQSFKDSFVKSGLKAVKYGSSYLDKMLGLVSQKG